MKITDTLIVEESHAALDGIGKEAVGFRLAVERKLAKIDAPHVSWTTESGDTGFLRALAGKRRDFTRIEDSRFREYVVLVSARPTGSVLNVSWLLMATARLANDMRRAVRFDTGDGGRFDIGAELDFFDSLDLNDFLAVTKLAFKTAIGELTQIDDEDHDESDGVLVTPKVE